MNTLLALYITFIPGMQPKVMEHHYQDHETCEIYGQKLSDQIRFEMKIEGKSKGDVAYNCS